MSHTCVSHGVECICRFGNRIQCMQEGAVAASAAELQGVGQPSCRQFVQLR